MRAQEIELGTAAALEADQTELGTAAAVLEAQEIAATLETAAVK